MAQKWSWDCPWFRSDVPPRDHQRYVKPLLLALIVWLPYSYGQVASVSPSMASLIERLRQEPGNYESMLALGVRKDDPAAIAALRDAFTEYKASKATSDLGIEEMPSSWVAAQALVRAGLQDDVYMKS